jgi:glycosyltransferase involved in cell wall biosynthesis
MPKYRFHCLGLPHTVTTKKAGTPWVACAYTQKVYKFCKEMHRRGHTVIHYGNEESDVPCTEHVSVVTMSDWEQAYGSYDPKREFFKFDMNDHAYTTFYRNTINEISKRKQPNDFLLAFWGWGHKPVCDAHPDMIVVEPGIGYGSGHFARWRVYESYAIRNAVNGAISVTNTGIEDWYHVVIPNYFEPEDYDFNPINKKDYFLFMGRIYHGKGADLAYQLAKFTGIKLIYAGQGSLEAMGPEYVPVPGHIEYVGFADQELKRKLLSEAKGFLLPSMYTEPFGGAAVEALLSGTPIITSDWGAFPEINIHGLTGYRCRTFDHFVWAVRNIQNISPYTCHLYATRNYSVTKVMDMYEEFFQMVMDVYKGKGWYEIHNERKDLDWLKRY